MAAPPVWLVRFLPDHFTPGKLGESCDCSPIACLRPVHTSVSIAIGSTSILSALVRVFAWVGLCGSDCNPGNSHLVSGLDLDLKWIFIGMKSSQDSLFRWKNVVVENVELSSECGRDERNVHPELNRCLY